MPEEYDDRGDVFRIVQSDWKEQLPPPAKLRERHFPVSERMLQLWRRQTRSLADIADRYRIYARYATVEDALQKFEQQASDLHETIERAVELAIDEERGR